MSSSSSSYSDSDSREHECYHSPKCVPVSCYYPTLTHPLVYFSEIQTQRKFNKRLHKQIAQCRGRVKSESKKTFFGRAFDWYTKGRCRAKNPRNKRSKQDVTKSKSNVCVCESRDFDQFVKWLDGKYKEFLQEQKSSNQSQGRRTPRQCNTCQQEGDRGVNYIMEPNPLVKAGSDSCTRGKSEATVITSEQSKKTISTRKSRSASSVCQCPSSNKVTIDMTDNEGSCGPENCAFFKTAPCPQKTNTETKIVKPESKTNIVDCRSVGVNCCECDIEERVVETHNEKASCACPTCRPVDSSVVNNIGTLIRTEKPYTVFVNDRSQTSDHSIKLDKDATGCYPFYMRVVCPDKLEPPCVCDYCPQPD